MDKNERFKITMPILKTKSKIVKDDDGNEIEERYVEGVASGTEVDRHGDRMTPEAIKSMANSLKQHVVNLNDEHDTSWSGEIGDITNLEISNDDDLVMDAKLNKMSCADDLWYALTEQNKKLGLSIGGYVKDYEMIKEGDGEDANWVRQYTKIDLNHIAVTSRPAYPKAWVSQIAKSIKNDEKLLKKKEAIEEKEKSKQSQKETKLKELARGVARSIQNLEADLLLTLVYKGLTFLNDEQILLLERSLKMTNEDVSLEAEKSSNKDETKVQPEDDKEVENSATPENESSEEETSAEKEETEEVENPTDVDEEESEKETSEETSSDDTETEKSDETEEKLEDDSGESEVSKEESLEKSKTDPSKEETEQLKKAVEKLTNGLEKSMEMNKKLEQRIKEMEKEPSTRKTAEVEKTVGDDDSKSVDIETLKKERDEKIEELKKNNQNDPNLFAKVQRIRVEYSEKIR